MVILPPGQSTLPGSTQLMASLERVMGGKGNPQNPEDEIRRKAMDLYVSEKRSMGMSEAEAKASFTGAHVADVAWSLDQGPEGKSAKMRYAKSSGSGLPLPPNTGKHYLRAKHGQGIL